MDNRIDKLLMNERAVHKFYSPTLVKPCGVDNNSNLRAALERHVHVVAKRVHDKHVIDAYSTHLDQTLTSIFDTWVSTRSCDAEKEF